MTKEDSILHRVVYFSGHVQGVGFRYQTLQIAKGWDVSGYVKNLADGRVVLEAQGDRSQVDGFIEDIQNQMRGYIRKMDEEKPADGAARYSGFSIR